MPPRVQIERDVTPQERELLRAMAEDEAGSERTRRRAAGLLAFLDTEDLAASAERSGLARDTVRRTVRLFNQEGWQGLIDVPSPRGGDFLSRYDQGYWAERLARSYLDKSRSHRAIPYGTSRSEPFTDLQTFREYAVNEFLLQAWSGAQRWKRPDLLLVSRGFLRREAGNDTWTPDLKHWDNEKCRRFVSESPAAVEVETSLWQVKRTAVSLSFTVKEEDLASLRAWVEAYGVPLYILQVFYDEAYVLPFSALEFVIGPEAPPERQVRTVRDRTTKKETYMVPLSEGILLGDIPEPEVEGRVFKAPNGRVTVYGRLVGSQIEVADGATLDALASGTLA